MTNLNKYHYFGNEHKAMVLNTFKKFLVRDEGFSEQQAEEEVTCLIVNGKQVTKTYYTTFQSRVGASKVLNRKQKLSVYMTLENAMNHVSLEVYNPIFNVNGYSE